LNAVKGGENFANSDNLFSHRLEDSEDYDERIDRLYYLNFCDAIPQLYNTYIFKETIERPPDDFLDNMFRKNVDGKGTTISDFMNRIGFYSSIFGCMHVLVDMPALPSEMNKISKAQVKKMDIYPRCSLIYPQQLRDWSIDANGNLRWIILEYTYYRDSDPYIERKIENHYKLITTTEWKIEDDKGELVIFDDGRPNSGPNPHGSIPLVTLYHKDIDNDLIGESLLKDIVYINRIIMNWCSCIDEQIERNTFSQLIYPDDGSLGEESETSDDPLRKISTSSIMTFPSNSAQPPQFISPNTETISVIWDLVVDHIKEIYRLAGLIGNTSDLYVSRSGRAAQMSFLGVNSALAEKAKRYEKFENEISRLAVKLNGSDPESLENVKYSDSFDVTSLTEEIDSSFRIMEKNFSTVLNKTMMKNIARKAIPLASNKVRSEVEDEIEKGDGKVVSSSPIAPATNSDNEGNPNVQDIGRTFKSKTRFDKEEKDKQTKKKD
jgi:hypothetical protein